MITAISSIGALETAIVQTAKTLIENPSNKSNNSGNIAAAAALNSGGSVNPINTIVNQNSNTASSAQEGSNSVNASAIGLNNNAGGNGNQDGGGTQVVELPGSGTVHIVGRKYMEFLVKSKNFLSSWCRSKWRKIIIGSEEFDPQGRNFIFIESKKLLKISPLKLHENFVYYFSILTFWDPFRWTGTYRGGSRGSIDLPRSWKNEKFF